MSTAFQLPAKLSLIDYVRSLPEAQRQALVASLTDEQCEELAYDWRANARPEQLIPGTDGASIQRDDWLFWVLLAGRGFGKTKTGAETVREWAQNPNERILLIAPTSADIRDTLIEGPSGLMSCYPPNGRPVYNPSRHLVTFPSGAVGITRSADEPERLRGPQFTKFWFDEICACRFVDEAWAQLSFGFRMKTAALKGVITTTPKPIKVLKNLLARKRTVVTRGSSYDNRANLSEAYYTDVIEPFVGTRLGRQEIEAEILDDTPGALWTMAMIDQHRLRGQVPVDELVRVAIAVDPAVSTATESADTGIVVAGMMPNGHVLVLEDVTVHGTPLEWARVVAQAAKRWRADVVCGERNNGGDLVGQTLLGYDATIPYRDVWASRGKHIRAQPVALLYEQGRVHHVGSFPDLESQMCSFVPGQPTETRLDRMDALVWAVTELCIDVDETPVVQSVVSRVTISRY